MILNKYKKMFLIKIKNQFSSWFETDKEKVISNSEVYSFLHSIKGTSGTLELVNIHRISENLLNQIKNLNQENWDSKQLRQFLMDLISLIYGYENFEEADIKSEGFQIEKIPLIQISAPSSRALAFYHLCCFCRLTS